MTGKLSVVATPIGNLEDISLRALRVLKEADYILSEDTRVTGKLLKHYEIPTKTKRYDAHASEKVHEDILRDLEEGKHIALVSDAGTPGVSDPGVLLIQKVREANGRLPEDKQARIDAIPGASALTAAFSISGIVGNEFTFKGFVPHKKGRQTFFAEVHDEERPVIFYESPHRIMKTLESLKDILTENHVVMIGRELTKMHEELVRGTAIEVFTYFVENPDHVRGEFVVLVDGK